MNKKKIAVIIEARYSSSRLNGKTMMEIKDRPLLDLLIQRVKPSKLIDNIIVATTVKENCDVIENYCKRSGIVCFRGSEDDVLERVLSAARENNVDIIVELTADDPLVDAELVDNMVKFYLENNYDYISTFVNKRTFPIGYDIRVFSTSKLDEIDRITKDPDDRENVSIYFYRNPDKYKVGVLLARDELNHPEFRLTVDEKDDFELMRRIFENFDNLNFSIGEVINLLKRNPELQMINKKLEHKNFYVYRAAIVGLGRMGHLFENDPLIKKPCTHAGTYFYLRNKVKLVAGCDIREDRLNLFKEKWSVKRLYKDYKEMLKEEQIDILSVSTHTQQHKDIVIEAAKSGVKAIFCEKPMALNLSDAEEMIRACKENNVILCIDHTRRFDNSWRKAKEIIDSGLIGDIKTINAYSTAGLQNGGSHLFDLLRFFNGEVDTVYAKMRGDETIDPSGIGFLKFKNGSYAFVDIDFRDYVLFQINLICSKGMLKCGGMIRGDKAFELFVSEPSPTQNGLLELQREEFPEVKGDIALVNAINEIIGSIETGEKLVSTGEDGLKQLEICTAFHESNRLNSEIKIPPNNKNLSIIPRETSFTNDGKFPDSYEKNSILPGF